MGAEDRIGLDSNCLSFLVDAMSSCALPSDSLADQKLSLFRCYLYCRGGVFVTPTVTAEWQSISKSGSRAKHESYAGTLIGQTQPVDQRAIDARTHYLQDHHGDTNDCRILAEAEDASLPVLLTFDAKFIAKLGPRTEINLTRPLDYWRALNLPPGAAPAIVPRGDNPLSKETWWRW